jgi:hypothetical protein
MFHAGVARRATGAIVTANKQFQSQGPSGDGNLPSLRPYHAFYRSIPYSHY